MGITHPKFKAAVVQAAPVWIVATNQRINMSFKNAVKLFFAAALAANALSAFLAHAQGTTKMTEQPKALTTDKSVPGYWRVTLNNPPINAITDRMYDEFYDLVGEIEADQSLKVVTFESANPDWKDRDETLI